MKSVQIEPLKFSEFFELQKDEEFDFVDIYAHQDIPLFLDPFGISAMGTKWSSECENQIATYFQYLIDSIRNGDKKSTSKLLGALHEVDEVGLGYSSGIPKGFLWQNQIFLINSFVVDQSKNPVNNFVSNGI